MKVFIDIETIPSQKPEIAAQIAETIKAPGNIKKAESIEEWNKTEKPKAIEEAVAKTALDGTYGQIVCIGLAFDESPAYTITSADEKSLLELFFYDLENAFATTKGYGKPVFIGHNLSAFDLRFLFHRAVINGVTPPSCFPINAKSWDESIFDTMTYWSGFKGMIGLDRLAGALGIEGKSTNFTWEDILPAFLAKDFGSISDYCKQDVEVTRNVYKRLTFQAAA
jgi:hypothetical protein